MESVAEAVAAPTSCAAVQYKYNVHKKDVGDKFKSIRCTIRTTTYNTMYEVLFVLLLNKKRGPCNRPKTTFQPQDIMGMLEKAHIASAAGYAAKNNM